jgi:hypothetical protein
VFVVGLTELASAQGATGAPPMADEGSVIALGAAPDFGAPAPESAVGIAVTASGRGWWVAAVDGTVVAAGDAPDLGGLAGSRRRVPGMAATRDRRGYWLATVDGQAVPFGDAPALGRLTLPAGAASIVAVGATPSGKGLLLADAAGGVHTLGDATAACCAARPGSPVVGMAATRSGAGYWLLTRDGQVGAFGDATALGAGPPTATAIVATQTGAGYWVLGGDGTLVARGDASRWALPPADGALAAMASTPAGAWVVVGGPVARATVSQPGGLGAAATRWVTAAAARAGARVTVLHRGNVELTAITRGTTTVHAAPPGLRFPMATLAIDPESARSLLGPTVADALARGEAALGAGTADRTGAAVGDELAVVGWNGRPVRLRVGAVSDDRRSGDAELVLGVTTASGRLGVRRPVTAVLWGAPADAIDRALGSPRPVPLGLSRTWAADAPDLVLSERRLKALVGEVAYRPRGEAVTLDRRWVRANIRTARVPVIGAVTCNRRILPALRGALAEVAARGLGASLGRYGGCSNARRIRGADSGNRISRHTYGIAIDLNTRNNSYGGRVSMNPQVVAIFRRWGFAWGGTWVRPDGMHFEWLGGPVFAGTEGVG